MTYLLLSIFFSTLLLIIFKFFLKFGIDNFQAIVVNYFVAAGTGFLFVQDFDPLQNFQNQNWFYFALLIGTIFISLFVIIAISSQKAGLTITSVANKMSLVIPVTAAVFLYDEPFTLLKITAIVIAILGIVLSSSKKDEKKVKLSLFIFPFLIFIGSGTSDTLIKYVEAYYLSGVSPELFTGILFSCAACIGLLFYFFSYLFRNNKPKAKNILAGIILGVPNYFSIHFLFLAISNSGLNSSDLFTINNISIVLASAFCGILFFKEKLNKLNWLGLIVSLGAILLIYMESK